jgi:hypothetical protein
MLLQDRLQRLDRLGVGESHELALALEVVAERGNQVGRCDDDRRHG